MPTDSPTKKPVRLFKALREFNVSADTLVETLQESGFELDAKLEAGDINAKLPPEMYDALKAVFAEYKDDHDRVSALRSRREAEERTAEGVEEAEPVSTGDSAPTEEPSVVEPPEVEPAPEPEEEPEPEPVAPAEPVIELEPEPEEEPAEEPVAPAEPVIELEPERGNRALKPKSWPKPRRLPLKARTPRLRPSLPEPKPGKTRWRPKSKRSLLPRPKRRKMKQRQRTKRRPMKTRPSEDNEGGEDEGDDPRRSL